MSVCNVSSFVVVTFRSDDAVERAEAVAYCDNYARMVPVANMYTQDINGLTQIVMVRW